MSTINGVPFRRIMVPESKYGTKCPYAMAPKKITVHNTDNEMPAINEINYMISNNNETSYHYAGDEKEVIQAIETTRNAWAAGDGGNGYGNRNTIHYEICRNYDRTRRTTNLLSPLAELYSQAEKNAVKAIAQICVENNIVASLDTIKKHQDWSGKWCPSKILSEGRWNIFCAGVIAEYIRLTSPEAVAVPKPVAPKPKPKPTVTIKPNILKGITKSVEQTSMFYPTEKIYVRSAPNLDAPIVTSYNKFVVNANNSDNGECVKYHTYHEGNGYVWIQYTRGGGKGEAFMPIRTLSNGKYGDTWGVFDRPKAPVIKKKEYIYLPSNNKTWGVYGMSQAPVATNLSRWLAPANYPPGLEYEVLSWAQSNVAVINTTSYGKVKIYVGPDTNARRYWK